MSTTDWMGQHLLGNGDENILNYNIWWRVLFENFICTQPVKKFHTLVKDGG
jgi:hypothetical protein